jgi:glutaminyl-peptide cyclotransferase
MSKINPWWLTIVITLFGCQQVGQSTPVLTPTQPTKICGYKVIQTYPHDPNAFTQGLVFDQGQLYESTGLKGKSSIRKVDLATGKVLQISNLSDRYFGEGITLWQDRLFQLTWVDKIGFIYDQKTFQQLATFSYSTQGWGITHNDQDLIMSDGSNTLYFLNPDTFEETKRIQVKDQDVPVDKLNELEFVKGEIWANVWLSDRLARIDPDTGNVKGWIDLTGIIDAASTINPDAVLNGIAYDSASDRLLVTGKLWSKLFEIKPLCP